MNLEALKARLAELYEQERMSYIEAGRAMGRREEIERLIQIAGAVDAAPAQPKGEDDAPET